MERRKGAQPLASCTPPDDYVDFEVTGLMQESDDEGSECDAGAVDIDVEVGEEDESDYIFINQDDHEDQEESEAEGRTLDGVDSVVDVEGTVEFDGTQVEGTHFGGHFDGPNLQSVLMSIYDVEDFEVEDLSITNLPFSRSHFTSHISHLTSSHTSSPTTTLQVI